MVYAQYRLGCELLAAMPPDMKRTVGRFRQLYDMGLHGPELLNFCNQGQKFRLQTGAAFFERVCRAVRMERSEGAMAYLYGLIAHYAISSISSSFLNRTAESLSIRTGKIRTEFDRYLLEKDGKKPPYRHDRSQHIRLTPGECETVALFYPGISAGTIGKCVKRMNRVMHLPVMPAGSKRDLVVKVMTLRGQGDFVMDTHPDYRLKDANEGLLRLYELAREHYSSLLEQIQTRLRKKYTLSPDFSLPMG
ncbi:MAG: hypothetical protein E7466_05570 [Ruminococcaceae bacterium]|nr:hypothetical protein [Oscillospiraceae bacterium]